MTQGTAPQLPWWFLPSGAQRASRCSGLLTSHRSLYTTHPYTVLDAQTGASKARERNYLFAPAWDFQQCTRRYATAWVFAPGCPAPVFLLICSRRSSQRAAAGACQGCTARFCLIGGHAWHACISMHPIFRGFRGYQALSHSVSSFGVRHGAAAATICVAVYANPRHTQALAPRSKLATESLAAVLCCVRASRAFLHFIITRFACRPHGVSLHRNPQLLSTTRRLM